MDEFTQAYIDCALWSSCDDSDTPLDRNYSEFDFEESCILKMVEDCKAFQLEHGELLDDDLERARHDFWLTRNGHGAGFWDGDWPDPAATVLTDSAHAYGSFDLYVGDDGRVYGS